MVDSREGDASADVQRRINVVEMVFEFTVDTASEGDSVSTTERE